MKATRVYPADVEAGLMELRRKRLGRDLLASCGCRGTARSVRGISSGWARGWTVMRILSVVDAHTRERLALEFGASLGSGRVTRAVEQVIASMPAGRVSAPAEFLNPSRSTAWRLWGPDKILEYACVI